MNNSDKDILFAKVSSNIATKQLESGLLIPDREAINAIGAEAQTLTDQYNVVIVYSGAITTGMFLDGATGKPDKTTNEGMAKLQRFASIGNRVLVNYWAKALDTNVLGNLLLTRHELNDDMPERVDALTTLEEHFFNGDFVTVNENDPIAHEEIAFGDNAVLTALLAAALKRSEKFSNNIEVVMLGKEEGVKIRRGGELSVAKHIKGSRCANEAFRRHVDYGNHGGLGNGGMAGYFEAGQILHEAGINMHVTDGRAHNSIRQTLSGEIGTKICA